MINALVERLTKIALFGGGWVLLVMMVLSVLSLAVMFERWYFFAKHREDTDALGDRLIAALRRHDHRGAEELLARSKSIEASVVKPALGWLEGGPEAVNDVLEAEMGKKKRDLERGMTFLGTVGNNAPFVGLLGTVLSVVQAFHTLGDSGGQNQSAMGHVMSSIAEALVATGVGLFVALPAVVAYNLAQKKIGEIEGNVGIIGKQLLAYLKSEAKLAAEFNALGHAPPTHAEQNHHGDASPTPTGEVGSTSSAAFRANGRDVNDAPDVQ
jgi:biopolymer transport protein ExbB/TolQ